MKTKVLSKYTMMSITLGFLLNSCDRDDSVSESQIEGHWLYTNKELDIVVTDQSLEPLIVDYINNQNNNYQISYEFKNDRTYYYYVNYTAPLKGVYESISEQAFILDDTNGKKNMILIDDKIHIINNLKSQVAKDLGIDKHKILKINLIEIYERGLKIKKKKS